MASKKQEEREEENFERWIHAQITDPVLWDHFEKMAASHQGGKSAFMRWLIDREWARRGTGPLSQPVEVLPDAEQRAQNGDSAHWVAGSKGRRIGDQGAGDKGEGKPS